MVTAVALLDGISVTCIIISGLIAGLFSIYKGLKVNQKLIIYFGVMIICVGFLYFGPFIDFLFIIFTHNNIENSTGIYGILSYMWVGPGLIFGMYLGAILIVPKYKYSFLIIYLILGIIFEFFLFFDTMNTFTFIDPINPGEELIKSYLNDTSPAFILIAIFIISVFIFNGMGALYRAIKSVGTIRKKFLGLSLGFILFSVSSVLNAFLTNIPFYIVNLGMIAYTILLYYGVK